MSTQDSRRNLGGLKLESESLAAARGGRSSKSGSDSYYPRYVEPKLAPAGEMPDRSKGDIPMPATFQRAYFRSIPFIRPTNRPH